jgi:hypothetical protein
MAERTADTNDAKKPVPRFVAWIDDLTAKVVAQKLNVTVWTVYGWRRHALGQAGGFRPDPVRLGDILTASSGKLVAADIYPSPKKPKRKAK